MNLNVTELNPVLSAMDAEALALMLGEHSRNARHDSNTINDLIEKMQTADIVKCDALLEDRVTMKATVRYIEVGSAGGELTLTWPNAAAPDQGRISVLSPMGVALLGRRVGEQVTVALPNGMRRTLIIEAVRAARLQDGMAVAR